MCLELKLVLCVRTLDQGFNENACVSSVLILKWHLVSSMNGTPHYTNEQTDPEAPAHSCSTEKLFYKNLFDNICEYLPLNLFIYSLIFVLSIA